MTNQDQTIAASYDTEIMRKVNSPATHIEIFHQGHEMSFGKDELPISLGRDDETCRIVVESDFTSRVHCSIEVKDNKIGLFDRSTNGTFIQIGRSESFVIKGSFYPLNGQGNIKLGAPFDSDERDNIYFRMVTKKSA